MGGVGGHHQKSELLSGCNTGGTDRGLFFYCLLLNILRKTPGLLMLRDQYRTFICIYMNDSNQAYGIEGHLHHHVLLEIFSIKFSYFVSKIMEGPLTLGPDVT